MKETNTIAMDVPPAADNRQEPQPISLLLNPVISGELSEALLARTEIPPPRASHSHHRYTAPLTLAPGLSRALTWEQAKP